MKIYLAADHRGFELKNKLKEWLGEEGHSVEDLGADKYDEGDDYPDFGIPLAEKVAISKERSLGVTICGSGVGMSVVTGKVKGVRSVMVSDVAMAQAARRDDDVNVIALGSKFIDFEQAKEIVKAAIETGFSGEERHQRRVDKIAEYEKGCKCA